MNEMTPLQQRRAQIIRAWLQMSGVSLNELGRRVTGHPNSVKDILAGRVKNPTARTVTGLARHLGLAVEDLEDISRPMPAIGRDVFSTDHMAVRVPEAVIALNGRRELDFVPWPGSGQMIRLDKCDHLSDAGHQALRIWRVWGEHRPDSSVETFETALVDIAARDDVKPGTYIAVRAAARIVVVDRDDLYPDDRILGRLVSKL